MRLLSHSEQVADYIIAGIREKRWEKELPGILKLSDELEVNHNTVVGALKILEAKGFIRSTGRGKPRMITAEAERENPGYQHIKILPFEPCDKYIGPVFAAYNALQAAGYDVSYTPKSLCEMRLSKNQVSNLCSKYPNHAWIVVSTRAPILETFVEQHLPVMALFGYISEYPVAGVGPSMAGAVREATSRLIELGHKRIVMLCQEDPDPAVERPPNDSVQSFLDTMSRHGLQTGAYNVGNCGTENESLVNCLNALFQYTPPTALFVSNFMMLNQVELFLAERGIRVPHDLSLVLLDPDPDAYWRETKISYCAWPTQDVNKAVLKWAESVTAGLSYQKHHFLKASFVESDSIGPAPSMKKVRTADSR